MNLKDMINNLTHFYLDYENKSEKPSDLYNVWVQTNDVPVKEGADAVFLIDFISKLQTLTEEEIAEALATEKTR